MIDDRKPSVNVGNPLSADSNASESVSTHRRHLALELLATRERFMQHFRPVLTQHNVTEQQWRVIRALGANGAMEPGEITRRCVILKPSLTGILSRMEELGWVTRHGHAGDLRRSVVKLTAAGKLLQKKLRLDVERAHEHLASELGQDVLDTLHVALDEFNAALDKLSDAA